MEIPALRTARLELVAPDPGCADAYERFYTDASASRDYGGPLSGAASWTRLAADLGSWYLQGFGVWALRKRGEADVVGTCGFWQRKGWPRELTWWILPAVRRQGLAKEASLACIEHAYSGFGWKEVATYMDDSNAAARAVATSLGGVVVARQAFPDGQERDIFRLPRPSAGKSLRQT